jgi:hypothetical protein
MHYTGRMDATRFTEVPAPWVDGTSAIPAPFVADWVRTSHTDGGTRLRALGEVYARLEQLGFVGCAVVAGPWLRAEAAIPGVHKPPPWPADAPATDQLRAEVAGAVDRDWLEALITAFFADPERARPAEAPRTFRYDLDTPCVVADFCIGGRRAGMGVFVAAPGAAGVVDWLVEHPATWWVFMGFGGLLRAGWYWTHWDQVVDLLLTRESSPWSDELGDRPVNAQEVTLRVGEHVRRWAQTAADAFEVATVSIFLPDPDDEYVWCLGSHGTERYAYDAGIVRRKPLVDAVGHGLTAAWACAPAVDPRGRPVVVRDLATREALRERYRDLGFDDAALDAPGERGPFLAERFTDPVCLEAVRRGPWVFTAQRLPRALSPSGRNLVVRFCGRTLDARWSTEEELSRSSSDRRSRHAAVAMRIHEDVVRAFEEGLAQWRAGLREEVLGELAGARRIDAVCRVVAAWCSARAVTLWDLEERTLTLVAWSRPGTPPRLSLDTAERLDARELRLLHAPSYPRRYELGSEGFLGWSPLEDALGGPSENVGTAPVVRDGRPVGLLRIDGAMSLFAGHIDRTSPQSGLHRHRPTATPAHVRPVVEEVVRLLAVSGRATAAAVPAGSWSRFVDEVVAGTIGAVEARARLGALHARAPTRAAASELVGTHRNTFRRQLQRLQEVLGDEAIPW